MSHIYIYSPSSAVRDKSAFRRGVKRLRALGHEVEIDADALSSYQRFANEVKQSTLACKVFTNSSPHRCIAWAKEPQQALAVEVWKRIRQRLAQ